jgi:hypothetical protein
MKGWWYYYLVAVAVKVPLTFWLLVAARFGLTGVSKLRMTERQRWCMCSRAATTKVVIMLRRYSGALVSPFLEGNRAGVPSLKMRQFGIIRRIVETRSTVTPSSLRGEQHANQRNGSLDSTNRSLLSPGSKPGQLAIRYDTLLPLVFFLYMCITAAASSRNYGVRYLLPLAPLAIVWISALGKKHHPVSNGMGMLVRVVIVVGLGGYVVAVAGIHPHELTYFNALGRGPWGGRRILADSNLDWGQGLISLARLQRRRPEFADLTFYYFGNTEPAHYGVTGRSQVIHAVDHYSELPRLDSVATRYLAVSASLQWGPWGPPGFFQILDGLDPVLLTDDTTIAIYRTADLQRVMEARARVRQSSLTR